MRVAELSSLSGRPPVCGQALQESGAEDGGGSQWDASFDDDEFEMDESPVQMAAHEADAAPAAPLSDLLKADILEDAGRAPEASLIAGFAHFSVAPETASSPATDGGWDAFAADFPPAAAPVAPPESGEMDLLGLHGEAGSDFGPFA